MPLKRQKLYVAQYIRKVFRKMRLVFKEAQKRLQQKDLQSADDGDSLKIENSSNIDGYTCWSWSLSSYLDSICVYTYSCAV